MPTGTVSIHKIDVWEIRRSASHWARLMGTAKIKIDTTILFIDFTRDANNQGITTAAQLIPKTLAIAQMKKNLSGEIDR